VTLAVPLQEGQQRHTPAYNPQHTITFTIVDTSIMVFCLKQQQTWSSALQCLIPADVGCYCLVFCHRNRTTNASKYPDIAWRNWLVRYNVSYDNAAEAAYRRSIFDYNLALAKQLNELAGPEVAVSD
jgi:hypothetical protein